METDKQMLDEVDGVDGVDEGISGGERCRQTDKQTKHDVHSGERPYYLHEGRGIADTTRLIVATLGAILTNVFSESVLCQTMKMCDI